MFHSSSDPTNEPPGIDPLPEDERHRILAVERRRVLLDVLAERETPIHVEDAAATVAEREGEEDALDAGTVERVAITLHHAHLPMLAECGIVDYDPDTNCILSVRVPSGRGDDGADDGDDREVESERDPDDARDGDDRRNGPGEPPGRGSPGGDPSGRGPPG